MAEEKTDKKPTRAERMYGKGRRIADADAQAEEKPAHAAAEKTAGSPEKSASSPAETVAEPTESGAIPMSEVHVRESKAMHTRHQQEYSAMVRRHAGEMGGGEGDKKPAEDKGKSGTEPG